VQLSVLGPVLVGGSPPRGAKERALLARLLVCPGAPVPAETLIEAAWPAERPDGVSRSLHVRLAKLRASLEIVREPAGYRLAVEPAAVDAHRFGALADAAAHRPPAEALALCEEALALWRGEPFADLAAADVTATVEARRLHAVRDRLRRRRAQALAELGRPDEAAAELAGLVAEDPLREELVAELMGARHAAGRHAEALDAYRELAARLADVGLQPSPRLRELESRILCHADEPAAPAPPTNVGARIAGIVGRDADLAAVRAALDAHRIVTLVGPAGVGKTTLAAEAARRALDGLPDGAWLVELGPLHGADEVLPAVGTALGIRRVGTGGEDGDRDALGVLRERLRRARVLLVLDNAEHLVPQLAPAVTELARAGEGVRVLVTSRRPLGLAGEAVLPVRPLEPDTAEALFLERAGAARPDWVADAA
jgi:DNA-binding SARP family transcriptional activator